MDQITSGQNTNVTLRRKEVHWIIKSMCVSHRGKSKEFLKLKTLASFTQTQ